MLNGYTRQKTLESTYMDVKVVECDESVPNQKCGHKIEVPRGLLSHSRTLTMLLVTYSLKTVHMTHLIVEELESKHLRKHSTLAGSHGSR